MKSKAYRAVDVNRVDIGELLEQHPDQPVHVGMDIGKDHIWVVLRWDFHRFDRPWKVKNPWQVRLLADRLAQLGRHRTMTVAMEPTGTYGDALRQALAEAGVPVHRVSPKMASDFAETFDGVPSQHDGKDAAVVAELAAQRRCWPWDLVPSTEADQELAYWVDQLDTHLRYGTWASGQLEGLLARHWPEATAIVELSSATLLRCLARYGGPGGLAADPTGMDRMRRWSRGRLAEAKVLALYQSARETAGVPAGRWEQRQLRELATEVLSRRRQRRAAHRQVQQLGRSNPVLVRQAEVVGLVTACVFWVYLGDPRGYSCGRAYCKAMGLNLAERSSGRHQGKLKISKRGHAAVRRWLYLAALRWLPREPVKRWYARQTRRRRGETLPARVGVMRKLALACYQVGGRGQRFEATRLFGPQVGPDE